MSLSYDRVSVHHTSCSIVHPMLVMDRKLGHSVQKAALQVVFVDQSRDLWIRGLYSKCAAVKLASMVDCAVWHDTVGMLSFIADHKLVRSCYAYHCIFQCACYSHLWRAAYQPMPSCLHPCAKARHWQCRVPTQSHTTRHAIHVTHGFDNSSLRAAISLCTSFAIKVLRRPVVG